MAWGYRFGVMVHIEGREPFHKWSPTLETEDHIRLLKELREAHPTATLIVFKIRQVDGDIWLESEKHLLFIDEWMRQSEKK